jgi:hypothetical protein
MSSLADIDLALQRYKNVATSYNLRTVKEFVERVRAEFVSRPASPDEELGYDEDSIQKEGYTIDGAISKCVYLEALSWSTFELGPDPSAAEQAGQIYHKAPESLFDALPPLIAAPLSAAELDAHRAELFDDLSRQANENGTSTDFEIPEDWFKLLSITQEVRGAGLPNYNNGWNIITLPTFGSLREYYKYDEEAWLQAIVELLSLDVGPYWCFGKEHRFIHVYYAFACPKGTRDFKWQILEYRDHECSTFDTVIEYLDDTSARLEARLGNDAFWKKNVYFAGNFTDHW